MEITRRLPDERVGMGMGLVPQGRRVFRSLSVQENLTIGSRPKSGGWDLEAIYEIFPALKKRSNHMGNKLSGGEQQMLVIGRALMQNPEVLLMDEPTEGLAPLFVQAVTKESIIDQTYSSEISPSPSLPNPAKRGTPFGKGRGGGI